MKMPKNLDEFWETNQKHSYELKAVQQVILDCGLEETFKWAFPTYTHKGANLISIGGFKEHYGIWFFQGVYLRDEAKVLTNAQEGKTKAMRQWKIAENETLDLAMLKTYVIEAIDNQDKGLVVKVTRNTEYTMPTELQSAVDADPELNEGFYALTPGRQKEYANYIADAKQEATKLKRIDKITPMILEGKGLNDRYK